MIIHSYLLLLHSWLPEGCRGACFQLSSGECSLHPAEVAAGLWKGPIESQTMTLTQYAVSSGRSSNINYFIILNYIYIWAKYLHFKKSFSLGFDQLNLKKQKQKNKTDTPDFQTMLCGIVMDPMQQGDPILGNTQWSDHCTEP